MLCVRPTSLRISRDSHVIHGSHNLRQPLKFRRERPSYFGGHVDLRITWKRVDQFRLKSGSLTADLQKNTALFLFGVWYMTFSRFVVHNALKKFIRARLQMYGFTFRGRSLTSVAVNDSSTRPSVPRGVDRRRPTEDPRTPSSPARRRRARTPPPSIARSRRGCGFNFIPRDPRSTPFRFRFRHRSLHSVAFLLLARIFGEDDVWYWRETADR